MELTHAEIMKIKPQVEKKKRHGWGIQYYLGIVTK
ncbi:hypothetical protein MSIBF_A2410002 [groundwater metagenome]|uniref:Uncharacterized protein n=1 Tax=groundwater metagenome TaxID=717931 RepID=A0A098E905_9ZZZZ